MAATTGRPPGAGSPLIARRIGLLFAAFFLLLAAAGARGAYLAVVKGGSLKSAAKRQQVSVVPLPAPRGAIVDRNGNELAVSVQAADIEADPQIISDPVTYAKKLAPILGVSQTTLLKQLADKDTGFVYLAHQLDPDKALRVYNLHLNGISQTRTTKREYPRDWLASQVLGSVHSDGVGASGLEYEYQKALQGTAGSRKITSDGQGVPIAVDDLKPTVPGKKLTLSLDANIQQVTEKVLQQVGATFRPKGATAIVMDPNTGALLAVANWPQINANAPSAAPDYDSQDRAVGFTYEPGSTFKAVTVAGALMDGKVTPKTMFDLPPTITVADRTIHEADRTVPISLSTAGILAQSSNIGAIKIGLLEGRTGFSQWVTRFGLGKPTGVDLPGEERGIVLPLDKYTGSSMGNMPIGQGIAVTPMQMADVYSAIANGGSLVTPHIVSSVAGKPVHEPKPRRVITTAVADELRNMLKGVFAEGGTAAEVTIPGYSLAGKTGTANKPDPHGGYSDTKYVSSFVGFAPASNPKLLVSVMVDEPQGAIFGAQVAAPAFGDIMRYSLRYLKIAPDQ